MYRIVKQLCPDITPEIFEESAREYIYDLHDMKEVIQGKIIVPYFNRRNHKFCLICNSVYRSDSISKHLKTNKHLRNYDNEVNMYIEGVLSKKEGVEHRLFLRKHKLECERVLSIIFYRDLRDLVFSYLEYNIYE